MEKIAEFFGETRFKVKVKSPNPSQWNITVLSIANLVQLAIRKQVGKLLLAMLCRVWKTLDQTVNITVVFSGRMRLLDST